ncbi:MAG: DUF1156 domain-containing protein [Bryobacterales bacterium]|nr:DUF1156 domain-containing protein [Bryobacterales bacterium]
MIPKERKRRAEEDFPIAEVSRHAALEKSIRRGQPSTLHLRRARRPHRWTSAISPDEGLQRIILTFIEDSTNRGPKDA